MTTVRPRPEMGWNALLAVSVVVILIAIWLAFFQRRTTADPGLTARKALDQVRSDTGAAISASTAAKETIRARTWSVTPELFAAQMLGRLTKLGDAHHLHLAAFRVGTTIKAGDLLEAPLSVNVQGAFPDFMAFVSDLEAADSKVALAQIRIATGSIPDKVDGTISMTGFLYKGDS